MLPNQYEALAAQHSFRPWQTGLLGNMLSETHGRCLTINMGSDAGHTYFARTVASSSFPSRTKIYVTRQESFSEFANLLFNENAVHEPIGLLDACYSYVGNPVDFVIVDMSGEAVRRFKNELGGIMDTVGAATRMILLQPDHAAVPDFSKF